MAKRKSKRPNVPEQALARARAEMGGASPAVAAVAATEKQNTPATVPNRPTSRKAPTAAVTVEDLKAEYVYVISDLRSMAILAGILFVALVVASLIFV